MSIYNYCHLATWSIKQLHPHKQERPNQNSRLCLLQPYNVHCAQLLVFTGEDKQEGDFNRIGLVCGACVEIMSIGRGSDVIVVG